LSNSNPAAAAVAERGRRPAAFFVEFGELGFNSLRRAARRIITRFREKPREKRECVRGSTPNATSRGSADTCKQIRACGKWECVGKSGRVIERQSVRQTSLECRTTADSSAPGRTSFGFTRI